MPRFLFCTLYPVHYRRQHQLAADHQKQYTSQNPFRFPVPQLFAKSGKAPLHLLFFLFQTAEQQTRQ